MNKLQTTLLLLFILSISQPLFPADSTKSPGTTGAPILKIGLSARAAGLSDTFSSIADDVSCVYYNPAGLTQIKGTEIQFNHNAWFMDSTIDGASFATTFNDNMSGFAAEYRQLSAEDYVRNAQLINNEIQIITGDKIDFKNTVTSLTYATNTRKGNSNNRVGITLKNVTQQIYKTQTSAIALDFGLLFGPDKSNNYYSFVIQNAGDSIGVDTLPTQLRLGTGYKDNSYSISGEVCQGIDSKLKLSTGWEFYFYDKLLTVRVGGSYQLDFTFSAGFGLNFKTFQLDYGYVPHLDLGATNRVSFTFKL
jgi:long-subunit fatty acid transport protein